MSVPEQINVRMSPADEAQERRVESETAELRKVLKMVAVIHQETLRQSDRAELKLNATLAHLTGKAAD